MKYIRTKDKRILKVFKDNVGLYQENDGVAYYRKETIDFETSYYLPKSQIVNQADSIEELCDEFVLVSPYRFKKPKTATELEKDLEEMKDFYNGEDDIIYGAIWTEWGLKYVAKMNDKGELVLLCQ